MNPARTLAALAVALACVAQTPEPALTGEQILGRAKAAFRAHERPPFVVYSLSRRDRHDGLPDFENSYENKVWCRSADRTALVRRAWRGRASGALESVTVGFDGAYDPGPPTADIFERALYARATPVPLPSPSGADALVTIGGVVAVRDYDYRVTRAAREGDVWHLTLEPKRDSLRNRIDELWVDAQTYAVRRMHVRDHLYLAFTGIALDEEFEVDFQDRDGLPLIATITGRTAGGEFETTYRFTDVSFPATLPDWYFEPKTYRAHASEAPT